MMSIASRLYLPKLQTPPATILDHLVMHFPRIEPDVWRSRVARGLVTMSDGTAVTAGTPYRHGIHVHYRKEMPLEPAVVEEDSIVYEDEEIVVAEKPHGMPVTPSGPYLERTLLARLQARTGVDTLAPMHRLDRETAGLVIFTKRVESRGAYHRLFAEGIIEREYVALSPVNEVPTARNWHVENRIERGEPWFRQRIVEGSVRSVHAVTEIELIDVKDGVGVFRLLPKTGKKHQLRLHMSSIGFPIIGDALYPEMRKKRDGEPPLQLIANRLSFTDPLSGVPRDFRSARSLV
jgi:tRNA pseudouridine32 synthase/23S rRNA pseudouridine746 synthase